MRVRRPRRPLRRRSAPGESCGRRQRWWRGWSHRRSRCGSAPGPRLADAVRAAGVRPGRTPRSRRCRAAVLVGPSRAQRPSESCSSWFSVTARSTKCFMRSRSPSASARSALAGRFSAATSPALLNGASVRRDASPTSPSGRSARCRKERSPIAGGWIVRHALDATADLVRGGCAVGRSGGGQRSQMYGVVVDTLRNPYLSRIGRESSVESLLMRVLP